MSWSFGVNMSNSVVSMRNFAANLQIDTKYTLCDITVCICA